MTKYCPTANSSPRRSAFTAVEMLTATSLLGAIVLFTLPLVSRVYDVNAATSRRAYALRELRNQVEIAQRGGSSASHAPSSTTGSGNSPKEGATGGELPERLTRILPNARMDRQLETSVDEKTGLSTQRHTMTLSWDEPGRSRARVQLRWWTFTAQGDEP